MFHLGFGDLAGFERNMPEREGELFGCFFEKFGGAPLIDEVFEASLLAIGAVAVFDEDTEDGGGDGDGLGFGEEAVSYTHLTLPTIYSV